MNDKLCDIGEKLNISEKEINDVKKSDASPRKGKIQWILTVFISAISFVVGFFTGRSTHPTTFQRGYPFAVAAGSTTSAGSRHRRIGIRILFIILPIIAFLLGARLGLEISPPPLYPENIKYGVYSEESGKSSLKDSLREKYFEKPYKT